MTVRLTESSLAKVGVELLNADRVLLECKTCGQSWSPNLLEGGRLPRGWWQCPRDPDHTLEKGGANK